MNIHPKHFLIFRVTTSLIFLYAGFNHLLNAGKVTMRLQKSWIYTQLSYPDFFAAMVYISGAGMITGALWLISGYRSRAAAVVLLALLVPVTLAVQLDNVADLGPFFKNVAIGGALFFIINQKKYETENLVHRNNSFTV